MDERNGILVIDKPEGFTSHDVIAKLRGMLHTRRIGHGGTLDPLATGVLPILIGTATRASEHAASLDKEYIATLRFGVESDTQDSTGTVVATGADRVEKQALLAAMDAMTGEIWQLPPMYSAIKLDGKKLVDLARQGKQVERQKRPITIHEMELLSFDGGSATFRVVCSKGTYVRTLCHDLGKSLGTCAVMSALRRTRTGIFTLENALTLGQMQRLADESRWPPLQPVDLVFSQLPRLDIVSDKGWLRAENGAFVGPEHVEQSIEEPLALCRIYHQQRFRALGRVGELDKGGLALFVTKNFG